jgi:hypothetical protein
LPNAAKQVAKWPSRRRRVRRLRDAGREKGDCPLVRRGILASRGRGKSSTLEQPRSLLRRRGDAADPRGRSPGQGQFETGRWPPPAADLLLRRAAAGAAEIFGWVNSGLDILALEMDFAASSEFVAWRPRVVSFENRRSPGGRPGISRFPGDMPCSAGNKPCPPKILTSGRKIALSPFPVSNMGV